MGDVNLKPYWTGSRHEANPSWAYDTYDFQNTSARVLYDYTAWRKWFRPCLLNVMNINMYAYVYLEYVCL